MFLLLRGQRDCFKHHMLLKQATGKMYKASTHEYVEYQSGNSNFTFVGLTPQIDKYLNYKLLTN